ncbi:Oidioi.mRNA.OKI2018_I69.PAR.g12318.t1.cds [Oikopleura dioica]|uniref:Oidioi.mRNA.OKI2018_I69.PAR.g12318.t1.cds n=1 Tax=Oikopleura dioica TaxID=34765 RepID=A0ABN7S2Z1_OIKDI|nr:Oidioi.mRNA.OKI2018_I69.PAR.g12318.t1.cds [Oikopleura dioica]
MCSKLENKIDSLNNDAEWLPKAFQQAQVHMKLLLSLGPCKIKFSPLDEKIYESFRKAFPDFDISNVDEDLQDELISGDNKLQWINWMDELKADLKDFDRKSLLRKRPDGDYTSMNTTFCHRAQFLAIEIARNKEGLNQKIADAYKQATSGVRASGGCCSRC